MSNPPREKELRFLVNSLPYEYMTTSNIITQGYMSGDDRKAMRVRRTAGKGFLTIKHKPANDVADGTNEFEYEIPTDDATYMLAHLCNSVDLSGLIVKTRSKFIFDISLDAIGDGTVPLSEAPLQWELDVFHERNEGLVIAEIEYTTDEEKAFIRKYLPSWIGREITDEKQYSNYKLSQTPYCGWKNDCNYAK